MRKAILVALATMSLGMLSAQTDILDARTNYDIDDEVTVTGIVTNDGGLGTVRYIQDETAGIAIYPGTNWDGFDEPMPGDEITVVGVISEFNGLLEVGPTLTSVTINSSGNDLPEFQLITPDIFGEDLEGELVAVEGCVFTFGSGCGGSISAPSIEGNTTYTFISGGETGVVYFRTGNPLIGTPLPAGEVTLYGIMSQFSFTGDDGYQLLPRNSDDIETTSAINLSSGVSQTNMAATSFDISWTTDVAGSSVVDYGLTPDLGMNVTSADEVTDHSVTLEGLEPGSVYYVQVSSELGEESTMSSIRPFVTRSESSGDILVYFNGDVDNSFATVDEAISIGADLNDTIADYITSAQYTLDLAIYNINNSLIVNAINTAYDNGVQIRYIAHGPNANIGLDDFNSEIQVHEREDDEGSGMHNKFVIIDADHADLAKVLTGSTNFTTNNLVDDMNNLVIVQDQSLARGYRVEFEEMWGSDGPTPDPDNSRFGANKTYNTPTNYIVGEDDIAIEAYFSPTDNTTAAIECAVLDTDVDLSFALLALTRDELGEAIASVSSLFVQPMGVIEQAGATGSEYEFLLDEGIDVWSHELIGGQVHHKYATIDHNTPSSDPTVITGSHNWSSSAENINDENTLIIHDERVANIFFQEFMAIYGSFVSVEERGAPQAAVYPTPTDRFLNITLQNTEGQTQYRIVGQDGRLVKEGLLRSYSLNTLDLSDINHGYYVVVIPELEISRPFIKR